MEKYEVTQKLLSFGPQYEVRAAGSSDVRMTIKGKLLSAAPKLTMVEGADGAEVATMAGNFFKTKYECFDAKKNLIGTLSFPVFAVKKSFHLVVGGREFRADGGFLGGEFTCKGERGTDVLVIAKQLSLRDKFAVSTSGDLPRDIALLAAVAIDQRFFQDE